MKIAVVTTDADGTILQANEGAARLFGTPRTDFTGRSLVTLVAEGSQDSLRSLMRSVAQTGSAAKDLTGVHRTGREFDIRIGLSGATSTQDAQVVATIIEIPPTPRPGSSAGEDRRVLETLLGNLPGLVYRCRNDQNWTMEYASDGCEALTGFAPSDLVEQRVHYAHLIHPDDRSDVWDHVQSSLAHGQHFQLNYRIVTADGTQKSVWEQGCGVYDNQGNVVALEGFVTDISERDRAERAYRELLDAAPDGIVLVDESGTIVLVNKQTEELFGYDQTELIHQPVERLIPARYQSRHAEKRNRFFADLPDHPQECRFELVGRRKDGSEVALEISLAPVRRGDQRLLVAGIRDNSENLAAQKKLRESEQRYQALADVSPVGIFRTDARGHCVYVNRRWSEITGLAPELASGIGWAKALDPGDRKRVVREWERATRQKTPFRTEYRFQHPDGTQTWVYGQATQETDGEGRLTGFVGTITDVTPLKLADREIRERDERFRQLADNINHAFWITDWKKQKLLYISPAYARIYGRSCASLYADRLSWHEAVHPEDRERAIERSTQSAQLGTTLEQEYRLLRDDGEIRWVHDVTIPVLDDQGEVDRVIGIVKDVTERKKAEVDRERLAEQLRQAQKMEAVGTFASGVAHDFNNVLTAICGYTEVARFTATDDRITEALAGIAKATEQGAGITRSLMTFGRKSTSPKTPLLIGPLVQEATSMLRPMIPSHTTITANTSQTDNLWVSGDRTQLQQIVMNLTINARDAMPAGGAITLSISEAKVGHDIVAALEIADTGTGMSPEVVEHLFEPFFTTKARGQGTGLGMAIVHNIVQHHGGDIHVATSPGQGTRITVTLPTCPASDVVPSGTTDTTPSPDAPGRTVLLAEGKQPIRSVATPESSPSVPNSPPPSNPSTL